MAFVAQRTVRLADLTIGAGLLAGTANVIMQLARPAVGYGVLESRVESGNLFIHPVKRTRTTLTYLAVATLGTEREQALYRRAVNRSHARVRSTEASPVAYDAFDPDLQLWVAACLYQGFKDVCQRFGPQIEPKDWEQLHPRLAVLGTTLQVPPDRWPADTEAFERYWQASLDEVSIDENVRGYLDDLINLEPFAWPLRMSLRRVNRFLTTGFLPVRFRDEMGLSWDERRQRRFDLLCSAIGTLVRAAPPALRAFPYNALLAELRWRIRTGRALV
jgi:uncharacterized protein (DUF2236 family)